MYESKSLPWIWKYEIKSFYLLENKTTHIIPRNKVLKQKKQYVIEKYAAQFARKIDFKFFSNEDMKIKISMFIRRMCIRDINKFRDRYFVIRRKYQ